MKHYLVTLAAVLSTSAHAVEVLNIDRDDRVVSISTSYLGSDYDWKRTSDASNEEFDINRDINIKTLTSNFLLDNQINVVAQYSETDEEDSDNSSSTEIGLRYFYDASSNFTIVPLIVHSFESGDYARDNSQIGVSLGQQRDALGWETSVAHTYKQNDHDISGGDETTVEAGVSYLIQNRVKLFSYIGYTKFENTQFENDSESEDHSNTYYTIGIGADLNKNFDFTFLHSTNIANRKVYSPNRTVSADDDVKLRATGISITAKF